MPLQQMMLTALPHGVSADGAHARITAFVTPRLTVEADDQGVLGEFADVRLWPTTLDQVEWYVDVAGVGALPAALDPESPQAAQAAWDLLFADETKVGTRTFSDYSKLRIRSFPVKPIADYILDLYGSTAVSSPFAFPPTASLSELVPLAGTRKEDKEIESFFQGWRDTVSRRWINLNALSLSPSEQRRLEFALARRFYERPELQSKPGPVDPKAVPPRPEKKTFEFHQFCSALADYPELMRHLGLAVDLVVEAANLPLQGDLRFELKVPNSLDWLAGPEAMRPETAFRFDQGRLFVPRPGTKIPDVVDGMLNFRNERFFLTSLDVDGSALKLVGLARTVGQHLSDPGSDEEMSLPALRDGGLTVIRVDRAGAVAERVEQAAKNDHRITTDTPAELHSEDVTRGYRLDVLDLEGADKWRSLTARVGQYKLDYGDGEPIALPIPITPDEGYVKGASATSSDKAPDDLYQHEALLGWEGWSVVAPRPGATLVEGNPEVPPSEPAQGFPLVTSFEAEQGSLPFLRFGHHYRVRARAVDLAGNSHPLREVPENYESQEVDYRRFEPISSPELLALRPFLEGESLERVVIRSTLGQTTSSYTALKRVRDLPRHAVAGPGGFDWSYRPTSARHVFPPKTSQQMAERHGCFDGAMGVQAQATYDAFFELAERNDGTFFDLAGAQIVNPAHPAQATPLPLPKRGQHLSQGEYVVVQTKPSAVPSFPTI